MIILLTGLVTEMFQPVCFLLDSLCWRHDQKTQFRLTEASAVNLKWLTENRTSMSTFLVLQMFVRVSLYGPAEVL